ncbi:MAG: RDD family protein [Candidatus Nanopelagicales bacterium]
MAILTGPIYFIFLATAGGQTVGKYVMGVRVVRLDGKPMTYVGSALRWFGYLASLLPLGLGFFWVVIDDRRRGFHDKIAGTCVIYSWRAQQNEYLLARIQRFFGRASKRGRVALMRVAGHPADRAGDVRRAGLQ